MDLDDVFNDQLFQFSPSLLSPPPEPFTPITDIVQDPLVEETNEIVGEEPVGLINNFAISEDNVNPSMSTQSPDLIPLPEALTLVQNPPEMLDQQHLLCNPHGYLQDNIPIIQSDDQPFLFNQNMLDSFQEPDAMQDQQFLCNPHGYLQGNTNGQLDQQSLFNPITTMNPFQEPNDSTVFGIGQQIEEGNSGYEHPIMTQSFDLPNHLQDQFLSLPVSQSYPANLTYQHGLVDSHFNINDQQPHPFGLAPVMVTEVARTCPPQNQIYVTPPLPQISSSSTRNQGNEVVREPSPSDSYPMLGDYAHLFPSTKAFAPIKFNVLWRQEMNNQNRFERNVLGRRQRNDQSGFERGESSSATQRRRIVSPKRNVDLTASDLGKRLQNTLYDPLYESLGLKIDPHLRSFCPLPKKNVYKEAREKQRRQEPDKRSPSIGKRDQRLI